MAGTDLYSTASYGKLKGLQPEDFNHFLQQRRKARQTFDLGQNQFRQQRQNLNLQYNQQTADLNRKTESTREELIGSLAAGGVLGRDYQDRDTVVNKSQGGWTQAGNNAWNANRLRQGGGRSGRAAAHWGQAGSGANRYGQFNVDAARQQGDLTSQWLRAKDQIQAASGQLGLQRNYAYDDIASAEAARRAGASIIRGNS